MQFLLGIKFNIKMFENKDYIEFKNWESNNSKFGYLTYEDELYFNKEIKKARIPKGKILEIGYGNGNFLTYCKKNYLEVVGYEVNSNLTESAKQKGFNVLNDNEMKSFYESNQNNIVGVFMFDVIEHLSFEELKELLSNIKKILMTGGKIVCRFPNGDSSLSLPYYNGDFTHKSYLGYNKLKYLSLIIGLSFKTFSPSKVYFNYKRPIRSLYFLLTEPIRVSIKFFIKCLYNPTDNVIVLEKNILCIFTKN